ncbi:hypothetical protein EGN72_03135 [Pseudorhodobacter sp. E13]|nr:hypothetical protein EGN72_03135 [Pseudorhodobacter sp. E13]
MAGFGKLAGVLAVGAALAGTPEGAKAETDVAFTLSNGEKVAVNVNGVPNAQILVGDTIEKAESCIAGGEARDICVAQAIVTLTRAQLDSVVRETHQRLQPLEDDIGLTAAELIAEPVFCDYAPDDASQQTCAAGTEAVQLAALDVQIAEVRERRIAAETRVANKEEVLESEQASGQRLDAEAADLDKTISDVTTELESETARGETATAHADAETARGETEAERADANSAVLAALQRVAAEDAATN